MQTWSLSTVYDNGSLKKLGNSIMQKNTYVYIKANAIWGLLAPLMARTACPGDRPGLTLPLWQPLLTPSVPTRSEAILTQGLPIYTEAAVLSEKPSYIHCLIVTGMSCNTRKRGSETLVEAELTRFQGADGGHTARAHARPRPVAAWWPMAQVHKRGRRQAVPGTGFEAPPG